MLLRADAQARKVGVLEDDSITMSEVVNHGGGLVVSVVENALRSRERATGVSGRVNSTAEPAASAGVGR